MGSEDIEELADRWWLGLRHDTVEDVAADGRDVVVTFVGGACLDIRASVIVSGPVRTSMELGGLEECASNAARAQSLVGCRVLAAVGFKSGRLRLQLDSGAQLRVPADDHVGAWRLTHPIGRTWMSLPGGGLSTSHHAP